MSTPDQTDIERIAETPRTDVAQIKWALNEGVPVSFARQLERELIAATAEKAKLEAEVARLKVQRKSLHHINENNSITIDELRATIAQLEAEVAEWKEKFKKSKDWNEFCEIEQRLLRSRLEDGDKDLSNAKVGMALELGKADTVRLALRCLIEQCEAGVVDAEAIKRAKGAL